VNTRQADRDLAQASRFTTVSLAELRGTGETEESPWRSWGLVGLVLLAGGAVFGGALHLALRPPSADQLFTRVQAAMDAGSGEALLPVEGDLRRFLELYPHDPRAAQVQASLKDLESYRLQRRMLQEARRGRLAGDAASVVQRALLEALALSSSDPPAAMARLEAIVAVFQEAAGESADAVPDERRYLEVARQEIERLRPIVATLVARQRDAIQAQRKRIEELAAHDPQGAARIARGLVVLYGDKPWAADLIDPLRKLGVDEQGPLPQLPPEPQPDHPPTMPKTQPAKEEHPATPAPLGNPSQASRKESSDIGIQE
jgi:hypothetical protein